jgi:signal transduction histidine kinase
MRTLISELRPEKVGKGGLAAALREHLANCHFSETLSVSLQAEGDQMLTLAEEQGLFRITQEALNNIVKHAHASHVWIRLHLGEPCWIEIQDNGCGFELGQVRNGGRVGLSSMRERAGEIGWGLQIVTSHGAGTRIRVDKATIKKRQV